ncbi:MAG: caspase family protein [Chitinophagales bacterium]
MTKQLYALLVGINDYNHPKVSNLKGCVNDVENVKNYLENRFDHANIEMLLNDKATYQNIIQTFRSHLTANASKDDVVLFHYSGHGAREVAASEFKPFFPEGKEETLVCWDSRREGGHDLADKELAVLIEEVAKTGAHVVVLLDCCHSGSGTRQSDDFHLGATRKTYDRRDKRPLETYLEGYYQQQLDKTGGVSIPKSKHILLAACDRTQYARETKMHTGVFTTTLLNTLAKEGNDISYADLYLKCRIEILRDSDTQMPQFETSNRFNAYGKFLDGRDMADLDRREVYREDGEWVINYGAINGLETGGDCTPQFELYSKQDETQFLGFAEVGAVFPERAYLNLEFTTRNMSGYYAKPISLPAPKTLVYVHGDAESVQRFKDKEKDFLNVAFTDSLRGTKYNIEVKETGIYTYFNHTNQLIQGYENDNFDQNVKFTIELLSKIARWENGIELQNRNSKLSEDDISFVLTDGKGNTLETDAEAAKEYKNELKAEGKEVPHSQDEVINPANEDFITLYSDKNVNGGRVKIVLKAQNNARQKLHFALLYFSEEFGIEVYRNEPIDKGGNEITLWGDGADYFLFLEDEEEYHDVFKLIVSTEPIKDFLLQQMPVDLGRIQKNPRKSSSTHSYRLITNDWLTKTIHVRLLQRKHEVTEKPVEVGNKNQLVIGGHSSFKAKVGLSAAQTNSRSVDDFETLAAVFSRQEGELLSFGAEHGNAGNVLTLNEIEGDAALKENPLKIEVKVPTSEEEVILSFTYDNGMIVPVGEAIAAADGSSTEIVIDEIPNVSYPDQQKRSFGKALKLLFFKFMKREDKTQQLRRVEYPAGETAKRMREGVKEAVQKANSIMLLVHGIIGDTEQMAEAFRVAVDTKKYDLVLTFDYENLNTPIIETADLLYNKLTKEVDLLQYPDKKLDIVAHSMGGLVSRYMIEKLGGDKMVRHLYMCGTPNNGSAISEVPAYRNILITMLTFAINVGVTVPVVASIVGALDRTKKLTVTLEEMRTEGTFIPKLAATQQPSTTYSIIAGNLEEYREKSDDYTKGIANKLLKSVSKVFYGDDPNDIAVSVKSIQGITHFDQPEPHKLSAACHHMNYFTEEGGFEVVRKEIGC